MAAPPFPVPGFPAPPAETVVPVFIPATPTAVLPAPPPPPPLYVAPPDAPPAPPAQVDPV